MKRLKFVLAISITLLFIGCTNNQPYTSQTSFNPNNKRVVFVEGEPYLIPYGSIAAIKSFKSSKNKIALFAQKAGTNCKKGDVLWFERNTKIRLTNSIKSGDEKLSASIMTNALRGGKGSCAHPLSDKEYQYYMERQRQQIANARYKQQREQQEYDNTMARQNQQTANMISFINSQNNSQSYSQKTNNLQHTWLRDINGNMYSVYGY